MAMGRREISAANSVLPGRRGGEGTGMSKFQDGDRVVVLRLDSDEVECHGCYAGESGPMLFVLPDDDDLPDPVLVGADRVLPEKRGRTADLAFETR
jgi:hypothetical protein